MAGGGGEVEESIVLVSGDGRNLDLGCGTQNPVYR